MPSTGASGAEEMWPATEDTLMMQPLRRCAHRRQHRLDAADDAEVVRLHHGAKVRQWKLLDRTAPIDAGVVDENVDRPNLADDATDPVARPSGRRRRPSSTPRSAVSRARQYRASSGDRCGFRIVAATVWPARPNASAVARPMPVLVPVMRTVAMTLPACVCKLQRRRQIASADSCTSAQRSPTGADGPSRQRTAARPGRSA